MAGLEELRLLENVASVNVVSGKLLPEADQKSKDATIRQVRKRPWRPNSMLKAEEGYDFSWLPFGRKKTRGTKKDVGRLPEADASDEGPMVNEEKILNNQTDVDPTTEVSDINTVAMVMKSDGGDINNPSGEKKESQRPQIRLTYSRRKTGAPTRPIIWLTYSRRKRSAPKESDRPVKWLTYSRRNRGAPVDQQEGR